MSSFVVIGTKLIVFLFVLALTIFFNHWPRGQILPTGLIIEIVDVIKLQFQNSENSSIFATAAFLVLVSRHPH